METHYHFTGVMRQGSVCGGLRRQKGLSTKVNTPSYSDEELAELQSVPKRVTNPGAHWLEKPKVRPVHKQRTYQATAKEDGRRFSVYLRQSLLDESNFSCGISYLPAAGTPLTLARYNGSSHIHGDISYLPHIHRATARAIAAGKKPESEAEETNRYETLNGALACLAEDYHLEGISIQHDHPRMF